jgi:chromosomal replication initiator protein
MNGLWQRAADRLKTELGQVGYETWIAPLSFRGLDGRTATLEAPNKFFRDWVSERYLRSLSRSLSEEAGDSLDVQLVFDTGAAVVPRPIAVPRVAPPSPRSSNDTRRPHPQLNPRYTFNEFVVGSANQFAHAAALAVCKQPGEKYNPFFLYGGVGLGKTHLVTAHAKCCSCRPRFS